MRGPFVPKQRRWTLESAPRHVDMHTFYRSTIIHNEVIQDTSTVLRTDILLSNPKLGKIQEILKSPKIKMTR
jgi:hypothetical protein